MRRLPVACVLLASASLASCSSGGGAKSSSGRAPACTYVAKLDDIANAVARADVHDPVAFRKTLDTAAHDYVTNVHELAAVAPAELQSGLQRVAADVSQFRFDAALTDRAELDAYAARTCGRVVGTVSSTAAGASGAPSTTSSTSGG
jgi:hypothetical protein